MERASIGTAFRLVMIADNRVQPNAELTGRRRVDGLAVRPMMNQGGRTAKLASRWRSG